MQAIQANDSAFAAILGDGSVVTWGMALAAGDSSTVQENLKNVQAIQATRSAFAAIRADESILLWGAFLQGSGGCIAGERCAGNLATLPLI